MSVSISVISRIQNSQLFVMYKQISGHVFVYNLYYMVSNKYEWALLTWQRVVSFVFLYTFLYFDNRFSKFGWPLKKHQWSILNCKKTVIFCSNHDHAFTQFTHSSKWGPNGSSKLMGKKPQLQLVKLYKSCSKREIPLLILKEQHCVKSNFIFNTKISCLLLNWYFYCRSHYHSPF